MRGQIEIWAAECFWALFEWSSGGTLGIANGDMGDSRDIEARRERHRLKNFISVYVNWIALFGH